MPEITHLQVILGLLAGQWRNWSRDERGSGTLEQILITTALVTAALIAGGILIARVTQQAKAIPQGTP